jgi:hypothetical protein
LQAKPVSIAPPVYKPGQTAAKIQSKGLVSAPKLASTAPPVYKPSQTGAKIQSKAPVPVHKPGPMAPQSGFAHKAKVAQPSSGPGAMRPTATVARSIAPRFSNSLQADFIGRSRLIPKVSPLIGGSSAQQKKGGATRILQPKLAPGVEAFEVNLQQRSGGWTLPKEIQGRMEKAMGADFSDVRVHVGSEVSAIGAIAFTWGSNIHFAPGYYSPHTPHGQQLLAHELTHVLQQRAGRVRNPFGNGVAVVQDHALEAEADRMSQKAAMSLLHQT